MALAYLGVLGKDLPSADRVSRYVGKSQCARWFHHFLSRVEKISARIVIINHKPPAVVTTLTIRYGQPQHGIIGLQITQILQPRSTHIPRKGRHHHHIYLVQNPPLIAYNPPFQISSILSPLLIPLALTLPVRMSAQRPNHRPSQRPDPRPEQQIANQPTARRAQQRICLTGVAGVLDRLLFMMMVVVVIPAGGVGAVLAGRAL